jgi:pimeloyl-ACP methyl ester carboxylesterase
MSILEISGSASYLEVGVASRWCFCTARQFRRPMARARRTAEHALPGDRPDLYGYGGTAHWPGRRTFHLECEAEIVLALLERVDERAHLVGHSYGGAVALHVAGLRGDLLRSLTLIEPVAFQLLSGTDAPALAEITEVADSVARATAYGEYLVGCGRFVDYWNGGQAWEQVPADKRYAMAARLPKIALEFHAALNEPTRLEDFRSMSVPTLLLHGTSRHCRHSASANCLRAFFPKHG